MESFIFEKQVLRGNIPFISVRVNSFKKIYWVIISTGNNERKCQVPNPTSVNIVFICLPSFQLT